MSQITLTATKSAADLISYPEVEDHHAFARLKTRIKVWTARYAGRKRLRQTDDRILKDIGVSRADALVESRKPFWVE